jgi:hypothetical protein
MKNKLIMRRRRRRRSRRRITMRRMMVNKLIHRSRLRTLWMANTVYRSHKPHLYPLLCDMHIIGHQAVAHALLCSLRLSIGVPTTATVGGGGKCSAYVHTSFGQMLEIWSSSPPYKQTP